MANPQLFSLVVIYEHAHRVQQGPRQTGRVNVWQMDSQSLEGLFSACDLPSIAAPNRGQLFNETIQMLFNRFV